MIILFTRGLTKARDELPSNTESEYVLKTSGGYQIPPPRQNALDTGVCVRSVGDPEDDILQWYY
jgi:hypothetical protein